MKVISCSVCGRKTPDKFIDGRCHECSDQSKKLGVVSWIILAELNDGREVTIDVDKQAAGEVDSFLADAESKGELEDWILKTVKKK